MEAYRALPPLALYVVGCEQRPLGAGRCGAEEGRCPVRLDLLDHQSESREIGRSRIEHTCPM